MFRILLPKSFAAGFRSPQDFMLIKLQDLKEGEIVPVEHKYDPAELDIEFVDFHYTKPLELEGTVEKGPDTLTFRGHVESEIQILCGRCLAKTTSALDKDFEFYYEIKGKESIDATDDVRELLMLEHSLSYLCKETCKGLCAYCGVNLNETTCSCKPPKEDSSRKGLSKLKDLWEKRKQE